MDRYASTGKTTPKMEPARCARSRRFEPDSAMAITASTGKSDAVVRKPNSAGQKLSPASTASMGGKMRLPAPKNIENSASPVTTIALVERFEPPSGCDATVEPMVVPL